MESFRSKLNALFKRGKVEQHNHFKMKLYSHQISPFTRIVEIVSNLTRTEIERQNVDLFNGEQKEEWFLKINPKHQVPALVLDDGSTLTESNVIAKYLVRLAGGHFIYPHDTPAEAAQVDVACKRIADVKWTYWPMTRFFGKEATKEGLDEVEASFAKLRDMHFDKGQTWIANRFLSLADLELACRLSMAIHVGGYDVAAKFPELMKGYSKIQDMPAWQKVHKPMLEYIETLDKPIPSYDFE